MSSPGVVATLRSITGNGPEPARPGPRGWWGCRRSLHRLLLSGRGRRSGRVGRRMVARRCARRRSGVLRLSTQTTSRKASDPSKATMTSVSLAARSCFCCSAKAPAASVTLTNGMRCSFAGGRPRASERAHCSCQEPSACDERRRVCEIPSQHPGFAAQSTVSRARSRSYAGRGAARGQGAA
jgi:hypothetical protein